MTTRLDNIGIVVEDLSPAIAFFRQLGLELEGEGIVEGAWEPHGRWRDVRARSLAAPRDCPRRMWRRGG